jgi:hypothetical protein
MSTLVRAVDSINVNDLYAIDVVFDGSNLTIKVYSEEGCAAGIISSHNTVYVVASSDHHWKYGFPEKQNVIYASRDIDNTSEEYTVWFDCNMIVKFVADSVRYTRQ